MTNRGVWFRTVAATAAALMAVACANDGDEAGLTAASVEETPSAERGSDPGSRADDPDVGTAGVDALRLDELQWIGTHNSYHVAPEPRLFEAEKAAINSLGPDVEAFGNIDSLLYTHDPLTEQLDQGIRAFELDVFADPEGGRFAEPLAPTFLQIPDPVLPTGMDEPGFKVIHIQDIDFISTCSTLVRCLSEIRDWSDEHPDHLPIIVQIELKDDPLPAPIDITQIVEIGPAELDALDAEIRSVFDEERLITPDDVRGDAPTLREAVTGRGWPTVGESRGKVLFFLDNGGHVHERYLDGRPNLEGRVAFTSAAGPDDPDRAVVKLNNPHDASIEEAVRAGYLVRTRADADLVESWTNDTRPRDAALQSGAQIVSTDFPRAKRAANGYVVTFDRPVEVRCNPVTVRACPTDGFE